MIYLERDTVNSVVVNLTTNLIDVDTSDLPFFIFEVIEPNRGETLFYFTADNVSLSRARYDDFNIELVSEVNKDLTEGLLYFEEGTYSYEYRCYITSVEKSIDPNNITSGVIHSGKLIIEHNELDDVESIYD